jgi:hypothetical protein
LIGKEMIAGIFFFGTSCSESKRKCKNLENEIFLLKIV